MTSPVGRSFEPCALVSVIHDGLLDDDDFFVTHRFHVGASKRFRTIEGSSSESDSDIRPNRGRAAAIPFGDWRATFGWYLSSHIPCSKDFKHGKIHYWFKETIGVFLEIEFLLLSNSDGPWSAPLGYFTIYESFFNKCHLWFLPRHLLVYCKRRQITISQLFVSGIRVVVCFVVLGGEIFQTISLQLLKAITSFESISRKRSMYYLFGNPNFFTTPPSKVANWEGKYFFCEGWRQFSY